METSGYTIQSLVTDLRRVVSDRVHEPEILSQVRPLALRAARSKDSWLDKRFYVVDPEQGFGVYLLHEERDHSLAILAVSWLPNRGTPPHDHGTWAVIAGVDGPERNEFFERIDDGSRPGYAELKKVGEKVFRAGDVLAMRTGQVIAAHRRRDVLRDRLSREPARFLSGNPAADAVGDHQHRGEALTAKR